MKALLLLFLPAVMFGQSAVTSHSVFPTLKGGYTYSNLQNEATSCPTYSDPSATTQNSGAPFGCWIVDSIDASGAAGAGIEAPTAMYFGLTTVDGTVASKSSGGALETEVSNMPPVTTTGTGSSGGSTIVVGSITNLNNKQGEVVSGTGIGSGAEICYAAGAGICTAAWDGTSTTIPLTVANSATVSGNVTFTTSFTSNALFYRRVPCGSGAGTCTPTQMIEDLYYLIPSASNTLEAIEFDPDLLMGNYEELASMQCIEDSDSSIYHHWRFWNGGVQNWTEQSGHTYDCSSASTTDVWHEFKLYATYDPTQTFVPTASGTLGTSTITVSSIGTLTNKFATPVSGTGIGSGAKINIASWDGVSTTIPLTVANSGTVSNSVTFAVGTYKYQTLAIDGVTVFSNLGLQFGEHYNGYNSAQLMSIQNQTDQKSNAPRTLPGNALYYDLEQITAK